MASHIAGWLETISKAAQQFTLSREEQRSIVDAVVDRITVGKDEIAIALLVSNSVEMSSKGQRTNTCALPFCRGVPVTLKSLRSKDYSEYPQTLGQHLKKRRRELGVVQREAAAQIGILTETYANWEKGKTKPVPSQFRPVVAFLGYDPSPTPTTLAERLEAKRRATGMTFAQVAKHLGWDEGTLTRYLNGTWRMPPDRAQALEAFFVIPEADLTSIYRLSRRR